MILQGLIIMVVGMGTVMLFLGLQVLVMQVSAAFFTHYRHLFGDDESESSHSADLATDQGVHIAVALAAIHRRNT